MIASIGKSLEALGRRVRPYLSPAYRKAHERMISRGLSNLREGEPIVVCDFWDNAIDAVGGRYYAGMIRDFIEAGYFPVLTAQRATVSSFVMKSKKSHVLGERFGVVRNLDALDRPYDLITDRVIPKPPLARTMATVVYQRRIATAPDEVEMPFFVHPTIAAKVGFPFPYQVDGVRHARLFFGGNTTEARYSKDILGEVYGVLNRHDMLEIAKDTAGAGLYRPTDAAAWLASSEDHPFVMFETREKKGGVPVALWMDALANSDFFLACPGVEMPLCHNLIEALSAGAIPILQYAQYLPAPLTHGVNALTFDSPATLRQAVTTALSMSREEVVRMRAGVHAYYQQHLAPGCFARLLFDGKPPHKKLLFNAYRVSRK